MNKTLQDIKNKLNDFYQIYAGDLDLSTQDVSSLKALINKFEDLLKCKMTEYTNLFFKIAYIIGGAILTSSLIIYIILLTSNYIKFQNKEYKDYCQACSQGNRNKCIEGISYYSQDEQSGERKSLSLAFYNATGKKILINKESF